MTFDNPVLPGFSPDPSVCRVGEDYYLVTSTFEYFPGLPLWHSRDLVHWRRLGHVLDRPEQLDLDGVGSSRGLFAPTIRHHEGVWYVVCTMMDGPRRSGHFVVWTDDPAGSWSDPVWLEGGGFDPSLFFDEDGRCWFHATRDADRGADIWMRELDLERGELVGEEQVIWHGAMAGGGWTEGPHLYVRDGWYYLLAAEGGTEFWHSVTVARAPRVTGPYEGCRANPVLTHRHLGVNVDIGCVGHADLVETPGGEWWATVLGVRQGVVEVLGRETFLVPVEWQDGWPVFAPGVGRVRAEERSPELPAVEWGAGDEAPDEFDAPVLDGRWCFLRTPRERFHSLSERPGWLRLTARPERLGEPVTPSLVLCRQRHPQAEATAVVEVAGEAVAALVALRDERHHYRLELGGGEARVVRVEAGEERVLGRGAAPEGPCELRLRCEDGRYRFALRAADGEWVELADGDARLLSWEVAGGFTGTMLGLYATGGTGHLDVDRFEQREIVSRR